MGMWVVIGSVPIKVLSLMDGTCKHWGIVFFSFFSPSPMLPFCPSLSPSVPFTLSPSSWALPLSPYFLSSFLLLSSSKSSLVIMTAVLCNQTSGLNIPSFSVSNSPQRNKDTQAPPSVLALKATLLALGWCRNKVSKTTLYWAATIV